jgi:hypothetical protein
VTHTCGTCHLLEVSLNFLKTLQKEHCKSLSILYTRKGHSEPTSSGALNTCSIPGPQWMLYKHHCRSSPYFTKQSLYYLPPMSRWQNQNSSQGLSLLPLYHFTPLFIYLTIRVTEGLFSILFSPLVLVLFEPKS